VWAVARRETAIAAPGLHWLRQDFAERAWSIDLPAQIDAVIHLAQSPHYRDFPDRAADIHAVAVDATMRLLDWAVRAKAKHFILTSTGGLYGSSDRPVLESDPIADMRSQLGFYFAAKRAAELLAMQYAGEFSTVILRCFFVYGSAQAPQMLLPRLVGNVRQGRPVQLHGRDGIRINPIHVDDAVAAIEQCLALSDSRTFNIAGPQVAALREIVELIGRQVGREPVFAVDETMPPSHLVADIVRMSRALGAPKIYLAAGIAELCSLAPP
jgi:UDP-glucose 4-epimerase